MKPLNDVTSEERLSAAGAQQAQCMCEYMSPSRHSGSTAGAQDIERSSHSEVSP